MEVIDEVKAIFKAHLEQKNQRKTPERFAILEEIYTLTDHFDVEMLYSRMKRNNYHVSRATVYNTLDLLLESGLVVRHQFGNNVAHYEKAYGSKQHDHLICKRCTKVLEFCDPRIHQIQHMMGNILGFDVHQHSLTLYGDPQLSPQGNCMSCGLDTIVPLAQDIIPAEGEY